MQKPYELQSRCLSVTFLDVLVSVFVQQDCSSCRNYRV